MWPTNGYHGGKLCWMNKVTQRRLKGPKYPLTSHHTDSSRHTACPALPNSAVHVPIHACQSFPSQTGDGAPQKATHQTPVIMSGNQIVEATCSAQGRVTNVPRVSKGVSGTCVRITTYKPLVSETFVSRLKVYFSFAERGRGTSNKYVGCNGGDRHDRQTKMDK